MVVLFASCVDESVKISEEDQKEICRIQATISKIEEALRTGRYVTNAGVAIPLMPDKRRELEFALQLHNESLEASVKKALGEQYSSGSRDAVLERCSEEEVNKAQPSKEAQLREDTWKCIASDSVEEFVGTGASRSEAMQNALNKCRYGPSSSSFGPQMCAVRSCQ
jgi:hypothetical protein